MYYDDMISSSGSTSPPLIQHLPDGSDWTDLTQEVGKNDCYDGSTSKAATLVRLRSVTSSQTTTQLLPSNSSPHFPQSTALSSTISCLVSYACLSFYDSRIWHNSSSMRCHSKNSRPIYVPALISAEKEVAMMQQHPRLRYHLSQYKACSRQQLSWVI
jgi:hypothetical protein